MENIAVYSTMQGLGDHLVMSPLARALIRRKDIEKMYVLSWAHYAEQVDYLYKDENRIQIIAINYGNEGPQIKDIIKNLKPKYSFMMMHPNAVAYDGYFQDIKPYTENLYEVPASYMSVNPWHLHRFYYDYMNVPWEERYNNFYFERNFKEEERVFNKLNPNHEEFVFVVDDSHRGFNCDKQKLQDLIGSNKYKIIHHDTTEPLFYYTLLLQHARQIHMMETGWRCFVETLPENTVEYFYHHYIRKNTDVVKNGKMCPQETHKPWKLVN